VGVGDASASPSSALLLHILQDSSGRVATILFAHRVGTALEPECKTYRLAADVFNDIAMIMDCLSPMIPAGVMRVSILSTAGVLRALCGVAGGSSKASLSAHFAKWGNLAELNAVGDLVSLAKLYLIPITERLFAGDYHLSCWHARKISQSDTDLHLTTSTGWFSGRVSRHRIQNDMGSTADPPSSASQPQLCCSASRTDDEFEQTTSKHRFLHLTRVRPCH